MMSAKHRSPIFVRCLLSLTLMLVLIGASAQEVPAPFDFSTITAEQSGAASTTNPAKAETESGDNPTISFEQTAVSSAESATNAANAEPTSNIAATAGQTNAFALTIAPATNPPPPDPRTLDNPGWWFKTELGKRSKAYPSFLGARFADSSRAVIIEAPHRKLTEQQPLVYRLWICNDLPQILQCRVEHFVHIDADILVTNAPAKTLKVKNGSVYELGTFKENPRSLRPGQHIIEANLLDLDGKILHHATETIDVTAKPQ